MSKEIRNANLIATVKTALPNVGYVKMVANSGGRKVQFQFRGLNFFMTSYLKVKEMGLGKNAFTNAAENEHTQLLENRVKS